MRVLFLSPLIILIIFSNAYAIDAGPVVPKNPSTQSSYCPNSICGTALPPKILTNYTQSTIKNNMIVIILSEVCQRMNENNIPGCVHMSELVGFDNSNQMISGKFVKQGNDTIRTKPQLTNHYIWYKNYKLPVVCVDCNVDLGNTNNVKQIIIEPHDFVWIDKFNDVSLNTRTFSQFHGRYMAGCDTANLAYDWNLLSDTIYYMRNHCNPIATSFNGTETYTLPTTAFQMNTQPLHTQQYFQTAKNQIHNCINIQCPQINTGKKW